MSEAKYWLYVITHDATGRKYIGQTNNPTNRKHDHMKRTHNPHLRNAIAKYGPRAFTFRVVSEHTREEIDQAEIDMIATCRDMGDVLFNVSAGGARGDGDAGRAVQWTNNFLGLTDLSAVAKERMARLSPDRLAERVAVMRAGQTAETQAEGCKKSMATLTAKSPEAKAETRRKQSESAFRRYGNRTPAQQAAINRQNKKKGHEHEKEFRFLGFKSKAEANAWLAEYNARKAHTKHRDLAHV